MSCVVYNAMDAGKYFLSQISLVKFYPFILLKYVIKLINGFMIVAIVAKRIYFLLVFFPFSRCNYIFFVFRLAMQNLEN